MLRKRYHEKNNLHLSIASAILWLNICSITVLTIFNYYVFHHKSVKTYQKNFIDYNLQVTSLAFKNIDQQLIQPVLHLAQLYLSPIQENAPILLPQYQSIADSSKDILALTTELQKISKIHPHVAGIDLYYEATNTAVTHFNNVHFPTDEQQRDLYLPWYATYKNMVPAESQNAVWTVRNVYLTKEPVILYIKRIFGHKHGKEDIILCAYIETDSFNDYIDQTAGNLIITTRDNQLLYSNRDWEDMSLLSPSDTSTVQEIGNYVVTQSTSSTSGLNYYYAVNSNVFYHDYASINHIFLLNFLLSIVFNVILLLIISHYNHTTYRNRIHILSKNTGLSIGEAGKSFDSSLNTLENEILKLNEAVGSSRGMMFQKAVRAELLRKSSGIPEDIILPYLSRESCCVVLINLPQTDTDSLPIEDFQEDYPLGLNSYDVLFVAVDEQNLAAVLLFDKGFQEQAQTDFISDLDSRLNGYRLIAGTVSPPGDGGIAYSYRCASEAARYQYIFTEDRILSYDLLKLPQRKNTGSHLKLFDAIQKDINNMDLLNIQAHIEMLVTSFKNGNYTIDYCQATLRDLVTLLYRIMQQNQLDTWAVFGYDIRAYQKKLVNIDDFYLWCNTVCETILKQINQKRQSVDDGLRLKILNLIDEHLEKDITLDLLADKLQIRPNTASRLFRQVIGTGYTEYIKNRKLERAKELIAQGLNIKDTAEKLGYSSAQYFIKVFKENYGITPYQYKKNQEQNH